MPSWVVVLAFVVSCLGSFFSSGVETGFVSWNILKVSHRAAAGDLRARIGLFLSGRREDTLAAILLGNNLATVGATLSFLAWFERLDAWSPLDLSRIISPESWLLTPFLVVFCEMLPKSLFRLYSFRLTLAAAPLLFALYVVSFPFTRLFGRFIGLFRGAETGTHESFQAKMREEMVLVAGEASRRGALFDMADVSIGNVLGLKDRSLLDVSTMLNEQSHPAEVFTDETSGAARERLSDCREEEVVVRERATGRPLGRLSVVELVAAKPSAQIGAIMHLLPAASGDLAALHWIEIRPRVEERFTAVTLPDGASELLDHAALLRSLFASPAWRRGGPQE